MVWLVIRPPALTPQIYQLLKEYLQFAETIVSNKQLGQQKAAMDKDDNNYIFLKLMLQN